MSTQHLRTKRQNNTKKSRISSDYIVVIPTYNRSDVLTKKTLTTLKEGHVLSNKIHIFLANEEEKKKYEAVIPKNLYHKMIVGVLGITNQRQYISKYFPSGKRIVSLDDDVEGLFRRKSEKVLQKITNLDKFFREAFQQLKKENLYLWGIYPVCNPFFMKPNTSTKLKFIIGTLHGYINRHEKDLELSGKIDEKEDYEQSIRFYKKDGGVLRFNDVSIKTKFHAPGGLGRTEGRMKANETAAKYLQKTYPDLVSIFHRKNGMAEIRLRESNK